MLLQYLCYGIASRIARAESKVRSSQTWLQWLVCAAPSANRADALDVDFVIDSMYAHRTHLQELVVAAELFQRVYAARGPPRVAPQRVWLGCCSVATKLVDDGEVQTFVTTARRLAFQRRPIAWSTLAEMEALVLGHVEWCAPNDAAVYERQLDALKADAAAVYPAADGAALRAAPHSPLTVFGDQAGCAAWTGA